MNLWGRHLVCRFGRHLAARITGQGCPVNRQARKPAPQSLVSYPERSFTWNGRLPANRNLAAADITGRSKAVI